MIPMRRARIDGALIVPKKVQSLPKQLSPIERARRALSFQEVDRVAVGGGFVTNAAAIEAASGIRPMWKNPELALLRAYRHWQVDVIFQMELPERPAGAAGGEVLVEPSYRSRFDERLDPADFNSPEDVVAYVKQLPTPEQAREAIDPGAEYEAWSELVGRRQENMPDILWVPGHQAGVVRFMWYMDFGFAPYFMALALYPEVMERLFELEAVRAHRRNEAIARCIHDQGLLPLVYVGEDICDNRGPMVKPEILRDIYFPHLEYGFRPLLEAGVRILWHVDGLAREIVPDLIAAGAGGFQGFQEELGMSLGEYRELRSRAGERLLMVGSVSAVKTMPFGTVEEVRSEVERCIDAGQPGDGFVLMPSSSLGTDVAPANIEAMYQHAQTYGRDFPRAAD
jgi:hypothetical protein